MDATVTRTDGRALRRLGNRHTMLTACRARMAGGDLRPTVVAVATHSGLSVRAVFDHFDTVEKLHRAALNEQVREAIAARILGADVVSVSREVRARVVDAAVFGRVTS